MLTNLQKPYDVLRHGGGDVAAKLNAQLQDSQNQVAELGKKLGLEQEKWKRQEKFIRRAQDAAMQKMKDDRKEKSQTVDDEVLEDKFQVDIEDDCNEWAYDNAVEEWNGELPEATNQALKEQFGDITSGGDIASLCKRYDTDIVVYALLSCFITENILNKPFLLFELEVGQSFAKRMAEWYEERLKIDKQSAFKWRYRELQWLGGSMLLHQSKKPSSQDTPALLAEDGAFFDGLAQKFTSGPAKYLLNKDAAREHTSLQFLTDLFKKAAQVGFLIWRQPFEVQISGFSHLQGITFRATEGNTGQAKTHSSQINRRKNIRPSDNAVVDFVVQPSVVARLEDGTSKVWSRAIVMWQSS